MRGSLDKVCVSNFMIKPSFFMPTIMTASIAVMNMATAMNMFTTRIERSAWAETSNMVIMPMLSSPIRSRVRSTTIEDKPGANPISSFSPKM